MPPAPAAPGNGAATRPACPGRCSTASTCGSSCPPCAGPRGSTPRLRPRAPPTWPGASQAARAATAERFRGTGYTTNGEVPGALLRNRWRVPRRSLALAERALEQGALSVRGFDRVLRVAWTLCDLAGRTVPGTDEVAEALGMRLQRAAA